MENKKKEPLVHISRRAVLPWYRVWAIRLGAVVLALVISAVISVLMTGQNPLQIYGTIFNGTFGSPRKMWVTLQGVGLLLCISLAVTPAFRMRFWNIGAEGQTLMGCLASAACMITLRNVLPTGDSKPVSWRREPSAVSA